MKLSNLFNKKFIKKRLGKIILPYLVSVLKRRKFFTVFYNNVAIKLTSLILEEDVIYHHFQASSRALNNFSQEKWEKKSVDLSSGCSLFVDIGGYNGIFGLLAAAMNKKNKVCIFEPDFLSAYVIHTNINLNNLTNVNLYHAAVGNFCGIVPIKINKNGTRVDSDLAWGDLAVSSLTLDSLIKTFQEEDFNKVVMKIDAEGFEKQCLEGMVDFVGKCRSLDIFLSVHTHLIGIHNYTVEDLKDKIKDLSLVVVEQESVGKEIELHLTKK